MASNAAATGNSTSGNSTRGEITSSDLLLRGLLAGLLAGCFAFAVAYLVGEPPVRAAISLEEGGHDAAAEVPRALQSTLGLLTGTAVMGTALGGLAGAVTALCLGRLGRLGARATSLAVAAAGFVALYAVPYLVYPPNPPAVGSEETLGRRTGLYFAMVAISLAGAVAAALVGRLLLDRFGGWYAALLAIAAYVGAMAVAIAVMPEYNEVGPTFPPALLFEFRLGSMLTQLALWAVLGVVLADLVHRLVAQRLTVGTYGGR